MVIKCSAVIKCDLKSTRFSIAGNCNLIITFNRRHVYYKINFCFIFNTKSYVYKKNKKDEEY